MPNCCLERLMALLTCHNAPSSTGILERGCWDACAYGKG
jgi:hypothetical protein